MFGILIEIYILVIINADFKAVFVSKLYNIIFWIFDSD